MTVTQVTQLTDIRNIGIAAHIDAGKTTTTERILFYSGFIHRFGEVHDGTTVTDWMEQEKERGITIKAAAVTSHWRGKRINLIDTPGHVDFTVEVERSMRVLDGVVIVLCAVGGVQPQTQTVWKQANRYEVPRVVLVNKMDRVGSDFCRVLEQIRGQLPGVHCRQTNAVPIQLPIGAEEGFCGLIDLLEGKAYFYDQNDPTGQSISVGPIPESMVPSYERYRQLLRDAIVETDDQLMAKYIENSPISLEELRCALRRAVCNNLIVPVLCGSAFKNKGIQPLLDAIVDYLPSPQDKQSVKGWLPDGSISERPVNPEESLAALSFKVVSDPFVGKLTFLRIYTGRITAGSYVFNTRTGKRERISRLVQIQADRRIDLPEASAGNIVAAIGLNATTTGDTLCNEGDAFILEPMRFPSPVISVAIEPKTSIDIDRLGLSLARLADEDPTFQMTVDAETGQTIISGMGELHLEIIVDRLLREFNVDANVGKPQVAYRETVTKLATAEGKLIRQTGGRGQYGRVLLRLEPLSYGTGFEFVNKIVGGAIPKEYIPAVEEGIRGALLSGVLAGYPVIDVRVTLLDGSYHEVDSSYMAFQVAGSIAFKEAFRQAQPVLLEPVMTAEIELPEEYTGDIISDMASRRGHVHGIDANEGLSRLRVDVPLSEMFGYATNIRNRTKGRGTFVMELSHYDQVPQGIALGVINNSLLPQGGVKRRAS